MGQLRPHWVLRGCHSRGCSWPCRVLCPKSGFQGHLGFRGLEWHTGAAEQGGLQEARTEPIPARARPFAAAAQQPLSHVETSFPSDSKPRIAFTPH